MLSHSLMANPLQRFFPIYPTPRHSKWTDPMHGPHIPANMSSVILNWSTGASNNKSFKESLMLQSSLHDSNWSHWALNSSHQVTPICSTYGLFPTFLSFSLTFKNIWLKCLSHLSYLVHCDGPVKAQSTWLAWLLPSPMQLDMPLTWGKGFHRESSSSLLPWTMVGSGVHRAIGIRWNPRKLPIKGRGHPFKARPKLSTSALFFLHSLISKTLD